MATGDRTHSVTTADLDGDGARDLIAAVPGRDAIAVALGTGDGAFGAVTHLPTGAGTFPKYAEAADLDGDGDLDIVSANQDSMADVDVTVFLGDGDGGFAVGTSYRACERPHEVEAADFDGDGTIDLAVACWGGDDLALLRGLGDAEYAEPELFAAGNAGHSLASADFDGDGDRDIAVAAYGSNRVMVLLNDGARLFAAPAPYWSGLGPHNLQLTDLDADGTHDLVVTAENSGELGILRGRGDGTFEDTRFVAVGSHPKAAVAADLDGDGTLDLASANTHGNYPSGSAPTSVSVLYGMGSLQFEPAVALPVDLTPFAIAAADLADDGALRLLTANWHSGDVAILRRTD